MYVLVRTHHKPTAAEFAVKEVALKSVLAIRNCYEFYAEKKHQSLPRRESGGTTDEEKDAVKRHILGMVEEEEEIPN
jgi:hypothetical protein